MCKKYKTLYADPPWPVKSGPKGLGANIHYPLMSIIEIKNMAQTINKISNENCHLYLWVTTSYFKEGFETIDAWGFKFCSIITWLKNGISLGGPFRSNTENCLFARKGKLPLKIINNTKQQGCTGFFEKRGAHGSKPETMRQMIEKVSFGPYLELFARGSSPNWDAWGNEAGEITWNENEIGKKIIKNEKA